MSDEINFHDLLRSNHLVGHILKDVLTPIVSTSDKETIIELTYTTNPKYDYNWWINIHENTVLVNSIYMDAEQLKMIRAENIPIAPARYYLEEKGDSHTFKLIFPPIPDHWGDTFHLRELGAGLDGFNLDNFKRQSSGRYFRAID